MQLYAHTQQLLHMFPQICPCARTHIRVLMWTNACAWGTCLCTQRQKGQTLRDALCAESESETVGPSSHLLSLTTPFSGVQASDDVWLKGFSQCVLHALPTQGSPP